MPIKKVGDKYRVNGKIKSRTQTNKLIKNKKNLKESYHTVKIKGKEYPRSNPNKTKNDNINDS